jgi:hypothetical protein
MSLRTMHVLVDGRCIDLDAPVFSPDDLPALAEMLAKETRFNGATPGLQYSVGEHSCLGSDAILARRDLPPALAKVAAAYFLTHDLAESFFKDDTTPKKNTIAERIQRRCGVMAASIIGVLDELADDHEAALQDATGLPWPPPAEVLKIVKHTDKVMFVTEWRDLMGLRPADHPDWSAYAGIQPLRHKIKTPCWTWRVAKNAWMRRATQLLPALQKARAS